MDEMEQFTSGDAKFGWSSEIRAFFTVQIFLTRLPAPMWIDLHPGFLMMGMAYLPLLGILIGLVSSTTYTVTTTILSLP
eukprot:CAMPEP_0171317664 /NCGR_PEP_ID=MMETSP0816-20121228/82473_1 /TAXON_ID=420281 /ORGANISM="Proboscia inermis, Strain CCAP1064/1" /LENGTH=78 /DNA_ID=CAMNT_0011811209 /DNA_START=18 /DNA_END=250 /DNA_ORIENTATION=-